MFEAMENMKPNWSKTIAENLKEHCQAWGYKWIEELQAKKTPEMFHKLFCNVTKTYFVWWGGEMYHTQFERDGNVTIKRCGHDYDYRGFDAVISIEEVLKEL